VRRRNRDVFELGQEQLLEEPAVELVEAEGPPVPPPADGPATEAAEPENSREGSQESVRVRPRVPSLGRLSPNHRVVASALTSLALGGAVLVGARQALKVDGPIARAPEDSRRDRDRQVATAPGGPARKAPARSPRGADDRVEAAPLSANEQPTSGAVAGTADAESAPVPGYAPVASPPASETTPPSERPQVASPELVAREFGP
jgi:hypothetical protein